MQQQAVQLKTIVKIQVGDFHLKWFFVNIDRAFTAVAQIESDAILAGLLNTASILSVQQVVKW